MTQRATHPANRQTTQADTAQLDVQPVASKILLVEDDAWLAELESSVLKAQGYNVLVAPHGLAAIDAIDNFRPDVIILDVLLAGSTGFALLNELQSYDDTKTIPVILCTNLAEQFDSKSLQEYGVIDVVDKTTMVPNDLVVAIKRVQL